MSSQQNLDVINVLEPSHKALITHKTHQSFAGQTFAVNFTKTVAAENCLALLLGLFICLKMVIVGIEDC